MPTASARGRPRRILYVIDSLAGPVAGTERQLLQLLGALDPARYVPQLAVLRWTRFLEGGNLPCETSLLAVPSLASLWTPGRMLAFVRRLRATAIDVVHVFFNDAAIIVPPFARLAGARVVASRRDLGFWYTPGKLMALRFSNHFVDRFVANCDAVRDRVVFSERIRPERISVICNGYDVARFAVPADYGLRARLGIAPSARLVGMVANLTPVKRHDDLIMALRRLRDSRLDVHLVLVGRGPREAHLRTLSNALGVSSVVHFLTDVLEPVPLIKALDVCVLCSESEGMSNAITEYMFCRRPVVCTNVGGNVELITHLENGLLVPVASPAALADAIRALLDDAGLSDTLSERAARIASSRMTQEEMASRHMALYDQLSW